MGAYQLWLVRLIESAEDVRRVMQMTWTWPVVESVHFLGLTLLFGSIAAWDLRLLGIGRGVPIAAFHRLIPFAVIGFAVNVTSGIGFLMAAPDQYIYNPAFHVKMLLVALAGVNVLVFYLTIFRRVTRLAPDAPSPLRVRMSGAVSLVCWMGVIVCGRMITFYRPFPCQSGEPLGLLADCIMR
jgi:uncharacterized membrane protein